jgi:hypothetical protein
MFQLSSMKAKSTPLLDASSSSPPAQVILNACKLLSSYSMRLIANIRSPILTYYRQGTTNGSVNREDHAVIYTGSHPPELVKGEPPYFSAQSESLLRRLAINSRKSPASTMPRSIPWSITSRLTSLVESLPRLITVLLPISMPPGIKGGYSQSRPI